MLSIINRKSNQWVLFLSLLILTFGVQALSIQHVSHTPVQVSTVIEGSVVDVRFALDEAASISLNIYDDRDILVRTVNSATVLKKGDQLIQWDIKDNNGKIVPNEAYHYTLEAKSNGDSVLYDITDLSSNNNSTVYNLKWDKEVGAISYSLSKPSRVRIQIGIDNGGPLLKTIVNWLPRKRGEHIEKWGSYDESHKLKINHLSKTKLYAHSYALSVNTILIGDDIKKSNYIASDNNSIVRDRKNVKKTMYNQVGKKAQDRQDYKLVLELPDSKAKKNGMPVYNGNIRIKINADRKDIQRLSRDRFEPIMFVDGEFLLELETGFFPLTWILNTTTLTAGEHYISVNIRGYDGQYGAASQSIYIKN